MVAHKSIQRSCLFSLCDSFWSSWAVQGGCVWRQQQMGTKNDRRERADRPLVRTVILTMEVTAEENTLHMCRDWISSRNRLQEELGKCLAHYQELKAPHSLGPTSPTSRLILLTSHIWRCGGSAVRYLLLLMVILHADWWERREPIQSVHRNGQHWSMTVGHTRMCSCVQPFAKESFSLEEAGLCDLSLDNQWVET